MADTLDVERLRTEHVERLEYFTVKRVPVHVCAKCFLPWPCDASLLLDAAEERDRLRDRLTDLGGSHGPHDDTHDGWQHCPTLYEDCHCTVETLKSAMNLARERRDKLATAMDLLGRASSYFADNEAAPDARWHREFFLLSGDHMILTEDGWTHGADKGEYEPGDILDEVNAPKAPTTTPTEEPHA